MNLIVRSFILVLVWVGSSGAMHTNLSDNPDEPEKYKAPAASSSVPVSIVIPHEADMALYLQRLSPDLLVYLWQFFSQLNQQPDNRGDLVMQTHARAHEIMRLLKECGADLVSNKAANLNFLLASEAFVKQEEEDEQNPRGYSFFLPNKIGLACALGTKGARKALKDEIDTQMKEFKQLHQDQKDKQLLDVCRRCPSKAIISALIENGASVNAQDVASNYTPLRIIIEHAKTVIKNSQTIRKPRMKLVQFLLNKGANVDLGDRNFTTPLMRAAMLGYTELVKLLAPKSRMINQIDLFGNTALSYGARTGNVELVRVLLANRARIIFGDDIRLKNVFVSAVEANSPETLKMFLDIHDAALSIQTLSFFLNVALRRAAELGYVDRVQQILTEATRPRKDPLAPQQQHYVTLVPDKLFSDQETALTASLRYEHPQITRILLEFARDRYYKRLHDDARSLALSWAALKIFDQPLKATDPQKEQQYRELLTLMLEDDQPNPLGNKHAPSACFIAARNENLELLKRLLTYAQIHKATCKNVALQEALDRQCPRAVHTVLRTFPDLSVCNRETGESIFFRMVPRIKFEVVEILDFLIAAGADVRKANANKSTAAHVLTAHPDARVRLYVLEELKNRQISIDEPDVFGDTPLHLACSRKPFMNETAEKLLEYGANPNARNNEGNTPLMFAVDLNNEPLVQTLLAYKADPNMRNNSRCGPLTKAARDGSRTMLAKLVAAGARMQDFKDSMLRQASKGGNVQLMKELLQLGANVNSESSSLGNTPLHKAVNRLNPEAISLLLENGADATSRNRQGKTALELSMSTGDLEIMQRLLEHRP